MAVDPLTLDVWPLIQLQPRNEAELLAIIAKYPKLAVMGSGQSLGGHYADVGVLTVNLRHFRNIVVWPDGDGVDRRPYIRVGAGISWQDILRLLRSDGRISHLSIQAMQSYSNFNCAAAVSTNVHGQDLHYNPLSSSIRRIVLATAGSRMLAITPEHPWFRYVVGGYGLLGIIVSVDFYLCYNDGLIKTVRTMADISYYPNYLVGLLGGETVFHSARLDIGSDHFFRRALIINYDLSRQNPVDSGGTETSNIGLCLAAMAVVPRLKAWRYDIEARLENEVCMISRNVFLDNSTDTLHTALYDDHYILQEYFLPFVTFGAALAGLAAVFQHYRVCVLNASLRYVKASIGANVLSYSPRDSYGGFIDSIALVILVDLDVADGVEHFAAWTQAAIDVVLNNSGTFYLPYNEVYRPAQLRQAYPGWAAFQAFKAQVDPAEKFSSAFWRRNTSA